MKNISKYNIKSYNKILREIGKGGFEGIKNLIEQNLDLDYGYIQDSIPEYYDLSYEDLNDNGKIIILNNIIGELNDKSQIIGTREVFEDFDWQQSLATEFPDIFNDFGHDIEQKIIDWNIKLTIYEIEPFSNSISHNNLMIDCYGLFKNLVDDLEVDPIGKNKVLTDIIKKLQESIKYNSYFLHTNSATKDDVYLLTEKINLLYTQVLKMIESEFFQYLGFLNNKISSVQAHNPSNILIKATVFGKDFDFIEKLHENLWAKKFIDDSCTTDIFSQHFFVDTIPQTPIILHGRSQSDLGYLMDSLRVFFSEEYQHNSTFFNTFWAERFMFKTNGDKQFPKMKDKIGISKIISSVKTCDRKSTKMNIIDEIVKNLRTIPQ